MQPTPKYIKALNAEGGRNVSLKTSKELKDDFWSIFSEVEEKVDHMGPEWEFACTENWDAGLDGTFDPAKDVSKLILGHMRKGMYVHRGREGVFRCRERESAGTRRFKNEVDGNELFAEEKAANTLAAARAPMDDFRKVQQDHSTVKLRPRGLELDDLVGLMQHQGGSKTVPQEASGHGKASGHVDPKAPEESESDNDKDEEESTSNRPSIRDIFGGSSIFPSKVTQPSAKTSRAPKSQATPTKAAAAAAAKSTTPSPKPHALHIECTSPSDEQDCAGQSQKVFMDGRTKRIWESLSVQADTINDELKGITFEEDLSSQGCKACTHIQKRTSLTYIMVHTFDSWSLFAFCFYSGSTHKRSISIHIYIY